MIFDLSLTPGSVTEVSEAELPGSAIVVQKLLAEMIRTHGAMWFGSFHEAQRFVQHVRSSSLSEAEKQLWRELLIELRMANRFAFSQTPSPLELETVTDVGMLELFRAGNSDHLFILPSIQYRELFPRSFSSAETPALGLSVATALGAHNADVVTERQDLSARGVHPHGYAREAVWSELFKPIVRFSAEIVIVDRYLFNQMVQREINGDVNDEHVVWLLKRIAEVAPPNTRVALMAGTHNHPRIDNAQAVLAMLLHRWQPAQGSISEVGVVLARGAFPHNRHIRLNTGSGTSLGVGFDLFEGLDRLKSSTLWDVDGFKWQYQWRTPPLKEMHAKEQRVATASTTDTVTKTF